jgi:hypothetical protein
VTPQRHLYARENFRGALISLKSIIVANAPYAVQ